MNTIHAKKNAAGQIIALSRDPAEMGAPGWSELPEDAPEVFAFSEKLVRAGSGFERSDLSFVRVIEDIIDLLIDRSVIRFTDLPAPAQAKLIERKGKREGRNLRLLADEEVL
jgi:hypothetical protein